MVIGSPRERADQEVRDPALVLGAHLARPVDAAHPHHRGRHAEAAGVVEHVLVGARPWSSRRACGSRAAGPRRRRARARRVARQVGVVGARRGRCRRGRRRPCWCWRRRAACRRRGARSASSRLSVPRTLISKSSTRRDQARRHRDLGGEVEDGAGAARRPRRRPRRRGRRRSTRRIRLGMALAAARRGCASTPGRARASKTSTSWPSLARRSARFEPMKPAPPVTRTGPSRRSRAGPAVMPRVRAARARRGPRRRGRRPPAGRPIRRARRGRRRSPPAGA